MKINSVNYLKVGSLSSIDDLRDIAIHEDFTVATIRETTEVPDNPQRETNIVSGLYDIFPEIEGSYEPEIMDKYDKFLPEIVEHLKLYYNYESIRLMSFCLVILRSGSKIYPHRDDDADNVEAAYGYCHRIHIPVQTNSSVVFTIAGEDRHLKYGEIVEIDNLAEHSVVNNGSEDRIHVLIDFYGMHDYYDKSLPGIPKLYYKDK